TENIVLPPPVNAGNDGMLGMDTIIGWEMLSTNRSNNRVCVGLSTRSPACRYARADSVATPPSAYFFVSAAMSAFRISSAVAPPPLKFELVTLLPEELG